jgi:hypothetical protein
MMHISEAELDEKTGCCLGSGRLTIEGAAFQRPAHDRLLLDCRDSGKGWAGITFWPVGERVRADSGFYRVRKEGPILYLPDLLLSELVSHEASLELLRGGTRCGWVETDRRQQVAKLDRYRLVRDYVEAGMRLTLAGTLEDGASVRVEVTLGWATLTVAGYHGPAHKFGHSEGREAAGDVAHRDPCKLGDLLISAGLSWPFVPGTADFDPQPAHGLFPSGPESHVCAQLGRRSMQFSSAPRLVPLESGFARSNGARYWIGIEGVGVEWLDRAAPNQHRPITYSAQGSGLGSLSFDTGCRMEPGDPFGTVRQSIRAFELSALLHATDLEIELRGELDEIEEDRLEAFRRERRAEIRSLRRFDLRARIPWALMLVRGFLCARRMGPALD